MVWHPPAVCCCRCSYSFGKHTSEENIINVNTNFTNNNDHRRVDAVAAVVAVVVDADAVVALVTS